VTVVAPTRPADQRSSDATRTCKAALRIPPSPRVRIAMSGRAAHRHLQQFTQD
jgi:hypothetical protein